MAEADETSSTSVVGEKYKCTLSAELLKLAEDELNEKEKWRERDIQALRDMVVAHKGKVITSNWICNTFYLWQGPVDSSELTKFEENHICYDLDGGS